MKWTSVIANKATDALYLSGWTYTMTPFSTDQSLINNSAIIAAKFSFVTMSYDWIKAYPYPLYSLSSIALNNAEDTLAIVVVNCYV